MTRDIGESEFVAALPDVVVAVAGLVTQLGDMWFVVAGVAGLFVLHRLGVSLSADPWRDCLFLMAIAVGSYSLTVALKHAFLMPRPPGAATATPPGWLPDLAGPVYESMVTGDGYGFPSGHATKAAAVYGAAAVTLTRWDGRRRAAAAGVTVAAVALSRVLIGVHYLVDVAVGVVVGTAFLLVVLRVADRQPGRAFGIATVLGVLGYGMSASVTAALAAGIAVTGLVVWTATERSPRNAHRERASPTVGPDDDR